MEYLLTPYQRDDYSDLAWWDNAFEKEELDWLQNLTKQADLNSEVGFKGLQDNNKRRSMQKWLHYSQESDWVYRKISDVISKTNANIFNYNLTGFGEPLQLTNYLSKDNGTYGWHIDSGGGNRCRKLSLTLQLSDPSEYEGGILEIMSSNAQPIPIIKKRGLISIFPSYVQHQVTPVTMGSRQSLVVWISGPPFK